MQGSYTVQRAVKAVTFGQCVSTPGRSSGRQAAAISAARRAFDLAAPVLRSVRKAHRPLDESSERWRDGFVFDVSKRRIKTGFCPNRRWGQNRACDRHLSRALQFEPLIAIASRCARIRSHCVAVASKPTLQACCGLLLSTAQSTCWRATTSADLVRTTRPRGPRHVLTSVCTDAGFACLHLASCVGHRSSA